jgi:transcriptional regulator with XRE-family HTH domain
MQNTIAFWRKERGMNQTELAQSMAELAKRSGLELQVGQKDVSRWETGQVEPSISRVLLMAEVLGVSVESLFSLKL